MYVCLLAYLKNDVYRLHRNVWNYGRHLICGAEIRRGIKKKIERNHRGKI